jgi:uncharacterized protein
MKGLLLVLALLMTVAVAQDDSQRRVLVNTVSVAADGKFEAEPDTAVVNFVVSTRDGDSKEAYAKAARAADRVRQALRDNGIDPKTAEFGGYSLQPQYEWRPKRKVIGFIVTSNVVLKLKDFSKVGPLLSAFSGIEETQNQSVSYILDNIDAAKQKAIEDAFNKAKASATTVARSGGRTLGDLAYASVDTFEQQPPIPMYAKEMRAQTAMRDAAQAPTEEFTPQRVTITARVNALFNLK